MPEFAVREPSAHARVIDITGDITAASEDQLMDAYTRASGDGVRSIVLNFAGLEYMNSGGIGLLVTLLVRAHRKGEQVLAFGLSDHYRQIFELTRLDEAVGIHAGEPKRSPDVLVTVLDGGREAPVHAHRHRLPLYRTPPCLPRRGPELESPSTAPRLGGGDRPDRRGDRARRGHAPLLPGVGDTVSVRYTGPGASGAAAGRCRASCRLPALGGTMAPADRRLAHGERAADREHGDRFRCPDSLPAFATRGMPVVLPRAGAVLRSWNWARAG